jgi:glycosyltransferase involved in cell wall biosynthesis
MPEPPLALSVIVVSYNMSRELPRTIRSLGPGLQRDIAAEDYEIIVVDNGSPTPPTAAEVEAAAPNAQLIVMGEGASPSPVVAINRALAAARGELIGVFVDGARMASPRVLAGALDAARIHATPAIALLSFHLGREQQQRSVLTGYDQAAEDRLLAGADWETDPYRLFDISVLAESSASGWFTAPGETNALFLKRDDWRALGGYDVAFQQPGGGLANHDIWARACAGRDVAICLLLGEATFHQVHGGVATNSPVSRWDSFHDEYVRIRGHAYERPTATPHLIGRFQDRHLRSVATSLSGWAARVGG